MAKISFIVLNYNGSKETIECVESLKKINRNNHNVDIIVVDNASKDETQNYLKEIKNIELIKNKSNLGYSGGNNVGIKAALKSNTDFICIINNDTKVDNNLLLELIKNSKGKITSPKIYFYPGSEFHKDRYQKKDVGKVIWYSGGFIDWNNIIGVHRGVDEVDRGQYDSEAEIEYATGACLFASREIFEKVGFFDEKYFLYLEDMDFCVRAKKMGIKIIYKPKAIMWHKNAVTAGGSGSKVQDYYITRNRLLFSFKYAKLRTKLAVLKQTILLSKNSVKRTALIDFFTLRFGKNSSFSP